MKTIKYVRKPLFVDAIKVTEENFDEIAKWCDGDIVTNTDPDGYDYIRVRVVNPKSPRQTKAYVGDWLLYTERGYKVYTDKAFKKQFDRAEEEPNPNQTTLPEGYGQGEEV